MKYVDASAVLRVLFVEPGPSVPLLAGEHVVSSRLIEVEAFRAVDRERLFGSLSDTETAIKRKELTELLARSMRSTWPRRNCWPLPPTASHWSSGRTTSVKPRRPSHAD